MWCEITNRSMLTERAPTHNKTTRPFPPDWLHTGPSTLHSRSPVGLGFHTTRNGRSDSTNSTYATRIPTNTQMPLEPATTAMLLWRTQRLIKRSSRSELTPAHGLESWYMASMSRYDMGAHSTSADSPSTCRMRWRTQSYSTPSKSRRSLHVARFHDIPTSCRRRNDE